MWPFLDARSESELADRPRLWRRSEENKRRTSNAFRVYAASELEVEHERRLRVEGEMIAMQAWKPKRGGGVWWTRKRRA